VPPSLSPTRDFALAPPAPQEPTVTDRTPQEPTAAVAYFIQSRPYIGAPWQRGAGINVSWEPKAVALARLASRREMQPSLQHRLMERITTVVERPATEDDQ
jgi:hypothetical protein